MAAEMNSHDATLELESSSVSLTITECDATPVEPGVVESRPESNIPNSKETEDVEVGPPYSIFTTAERRMTLVMAAFAAFISPLSSTIYLPALNTLASHYDVSNSLINLTVTSYLIFQGIGPTIFGNFADEAGRRPAYLTAFGIYLATNIALALQNSYAALIVLRMLQSTGASASTVICMGVIADMTTTEKRGIYLGLVVSGTMLGVRMVSILFGDFICVVPSSDE